MSWINTIKGHYFAFRYTAVKQEMKSVSLSVSKLSAAPQKEELLKKKHLISAYYLITFVTRFGSKVFYAL